MDPETKALLDQSLELAKQNNAMLLKLVRAQKMATYYRIAYWAIIILVTFGSFIFLQPLLGNLLNVYTGGAANGNIMDSIKNLNSSTQQKQVQDLLKSLQ
jgi:hypothetical protein